MSQLKVLEALSTPYAIKHGVEIEALADAVYADNQNGGPEHSLSTVRVFIHKLRSKGYRITNDFVGRSNKARYFLKQNSNKEAIEIGLKYARQAYRVAQFGLSMSGNESLEPELRRQILEAAEDIKKMEVELNS